MPPSFLCIGAPRAGTTWLYHNIKLHPGVWMPPMKEIHYLDGWPPLPLIASVPNPMTFAARRDALRRLLHKNAHGKWDTSWHLRFLMLPRTEQWYASLFSPGKGRITGDITPTYAPIGASLVARAYALSPNAKLIYLLRNPITQAWSQAAMHFRIWYRRDLSTLPDECIRRYLGGKKRARHLNYTQNVHTWSRFYPASQIHVDFFDRLVEDPSSLLQDIYRFLELDASGHLIPETVQEKCNAKSYPSIPDHLSRYLARRYYTQIELAHRHFENRYTAKWLDVAQQSLTT
jgi:hypothetical protein